MSLKLVLNSQKTKFFFSCFHKLSHKYFFPSDGKIIERVPSYKHFWTDDKLLFDVHIANLIRMLKVKLGFYFRNKSNFTFSPCVVSYFCYSASVHGSGGQSNTIKTQSNNFMLNTQQMFSLSQLQAIKTAYMLIFCPLPLLD